MSKIRDIAPAPTEGDLDKQSFSGPVNTIPSRDATPATSAAQQSDNIAHALAGAGGGIIAMTLTYPLITLSTRAQVESKRADTSTLAAVKHIINREGISGLYAGLDSALFGISITNFVYYYWYEWTRAFFERAALKAGRASKKLTTVESMIAGAIAGSATVLITNPIWVINTRMTARKGEAETDELPGGEKRVAKKPSTIGTLLKLLKEEGPAALFAGVLPALVLVINPILQYTIYEQLKNTLEKRKKVGPRDAFYLGAIGKLLATTITYPYLTVKSRAHVATKDAPVQGIWKSLNKIVDEEGWGGLYKGMTMPPLPGSPAGRLLICIHRNRTQGQPECLDCRIPLCFQGCLVRLDHRSSSEGKNCQGLNQSTRSCPKPSRRDSEDDCAGHAKFRSLSLLVCLLASSTAISLQSGGECYPGSAKSESEGIF